MASAVGERAYRGHTVLTLDMAYTNARLVARPDSDWLLPRALPASSSDDGLESSAGADADIYVSETTLAIELDDGETRVVRRTPARP